MGACHYHSQEKYIIFALNASLNSALCTSVISDFVIGRKGSDISMPIFVL